MSGYYGYSMSNNAVMAYEDGKSLCQSGQKQRLFQQFKLQLMTEK